MLKFGAHVPTQHEILYPGSKYETTYKLLEFVPTVYNWLLLFQSTHCYSDNLYVYLEPARK